MNYFDRLIQSRFFYMFRGIAIISVAYAHSLSLSDEILQRVGAAIGILGVPIFLFCSGFYFKRQKWRELLTKLLAGIVSPWLLWGTVAFVISVALGAASNNLISFLAFLFGHGTWLYYIPVYLTIQILFNISDNPYFIAASIIVSLASNVISFIPPPSSGLAPIITLWQNPLNWMEFFAMGILFNRLGLLEKVINGKFRIKFILVVITVLIAGLLVWVPLKINYWNPLAIVLEFVSIVSIPIITFKFIDSKSLSSLGRNSYLLYLLHMQLGIALANILFSIVSVPDFIILLTKPLIVLGITMCLIFLIKLTVRLLKLDRFNQYIGLYSNGTK